MAVNDRKIKQDELDKKWYVLKKEMVFIGKLMWVREFGPFNTQQQAQEKLNKEN